VLVRERTQVARGGASTRERAWAATLWIGALAAMFGINESVIPAFEKMFKEVGVNLPLPTELLLGGGGWVWALSILSLLHAAALVQEQRTRVNLRVAAFVAGVLGGAFGVVALFLPLCSLTQKL